MWQSLPEAAWQHMHLDTKTLLVARQVCRDWRLQASLAITDICVRPVGARRPVQNRRVSMLWLQRDKQSVGKACSSGRVVVGVVFVKCCSLSLQNPRASLACWLSALSLRVWQA